MLGACAVVTGVFGMNLPNAYQDSPHALAEITLWMVLAGVAAWVAVILVAIRSGVITWAPWYAEGHGEN